MADNLCCFYFVNKSMNLILQHTYVCICYKQSIINIKKIKHLNLIVKEHSYVQCIANIVHCC